VAQEEYRLLGSALLLDRFTSDELSKAAHVNLNTCRSWLRRHAQYMEPDGEKAAGGPGRPSKRYRLTRDGNSQLRGLLDGLYATIESASSDLSQSRLLDGVEEKFRLWQAVRGDPDLEGRAEEAALRAAVVLAWQEFAHLDGAGVSVDRSRMRQLADLEREAKVASPPDAGLVQTAKWVAERVGRIARRGARLDFAANTMWLRAEVRPEPEAVRITAASLAAAVWSDEDIADDAVSQDDLWNSRRVAETAPMALRIKYAWAAIDGRSGTAHRLDDPDAQAVARGLTSCRDAKTSDELHDTLACARLKTGWREALAPVIIHGLLDAPNISLPRLVEDLSDALERSVCRLGVEGKLRREALTYGRRALGNHKQPALRSDDIQMLATGLAWRPERSD
jgi:hypothetical protein